MSLHVDLELLSGVVTVVWFVAFVGLCLWAWSRGRRSVYAAAARMPLDVTADNCTAPQDGSS